MNDKNLPPEGHQPPPPPPEKHRKHEKRRRKGPSFGTVFLLIIILAVAVLVILWKNDLIHFGKEAGKGEGEGGTSIVSSVPESETSEVSTEIEIKVENDKIYFDGKEVANADELKTKITEIGDKKTYNFIHDSAIKGTYDDVKAVLNDLERALSIKVNYNETSE